jgi:hypothetical protein
MPHDLDEDEIDHYYKAIETDEHSGGSEFVSKAIHAGIMDLWVYNDKHSVLVAITRFIDHPDGFREMLVAMMSGENITDTSSHSEIYSGMMKYAVLNGCQRMVAYMKPEVWENMEERLPQYTQEYVVLGLYPEDVEEW